MLRSTPPLIPDALFQETLATGSKSAAGEGGATGGVDVRACGLTRYLNEASEMPLLTPEEEVTLAERIKNGDEVAREHMIRANLRLVVKIARDYEGLGVPLLDLINEGNMGLMRAVERFDPAKGGKLSTYGSWWIKQSVRRAVANQSKTIRLPIHLVDKVSRMRKAANRLQEILGREPSDDELADELRTTPKKIRLWKRSAQHTASLDAPVGEDGAATLGEWVADERVRMPGDELEETGVHQAVRDVISVLDARELTIINERFGLKGGREKTLEEIGAKFGVTRERIRQVQNIALNKLRRAMQRFETVSMMPA